MSDPTGPRDAGGPEGPAPARPPLSAEGEARLQVLVGRLAETRTAAASPSSSRRLLVVAAAAAAVVVGVAALSGSRAGSSERVVAAPAFGEGTVLLLGVDTFEADVAAALDPDDPAAAFSSSLTLRMNGGACAPAAYGEGELLAVIFDGEPAVLAIRPAAGGSRAIEVMACGSGRVLARTDR